MTPAQSAELKRLDTAITAAPGEADGYRERAQFLSAHGGDFARIVADVRAELQIAPDELSNLSRFRRGRTRPKTAANSQDRRNRLIGAGRAAWQLAKRPLDHFIAKFLLARAIVLFETALRETPDLKRWHARRGDGWDALETLERAATFDLRAAPRELETTDVETLKMWALALFITRDDEAETSADETLSSNNRALRLAATVYGRAVRLELAGHAWQHDASHHARRARNTQSEAYQQLAWWNLAIEAAPHAPQLWQARARWKVRSGHPNAADFARAIALAPDDAYFYEARAWANSVGGKWWDLRDETSAASDWTRAFSRRIAAGQIDGTPENLIALGDRQCRHLERPKGHERAYAFYSLAIAGRPNAVAQWYLKRARTLAPGRRLPASQAARDAEYWDCLHALALDGTLAGARFNIVEYLREATKRDSAHEQIEALLRARQFLLDCNIEARLADAIIAQVEAALAA